MELPRGCGFTSWCLISSGGTYGWGVGLWRHTGVIEWQFMLMRPWNPQNISPGYEAVYRRWMNRMKFCYWTMLIWGTKFLTFHFCNEIFLNVSQQCLHIKISWLVIFWSQFIVKVVVITSRALLLHAMMQLFIELSLCNYSSMVCSKLLI